MPSRDLLGKIVDEYHLDKEEVLTLFTQGTPDEFGAYLREHVFKTDTGAGGGSAETGVPTHEQFDAGAGPDSAAA